MFSGFFVIISPRYLLEKLWLGGFGIVMAAGLVSLAPGISQQAFIEIIVSLGTVLVVYVLMEAIYSLVSWLRLRKHMQQVGPPKFMPQMLERMTLLALFESEKQVGYEHTVIDSGEGWVLYDLVVRIRRSTKHGSYLAKTLTFSVYQRRLQRQIPNLIFDNKRAHRRQFKSYFIDGQKLSFEGNFDRIYDSYAPQTYHIDTLSVISPEVLGAMIDFSLPADVEFLDDTLICFSPLINYADKEQFKHQADNLYQHVNDNLDTYRDDRLLAEARKNQVHGFARELLRSPWRRKYLLMLGIVLAIATILYPFFGDAEIVVDPRYWLLGLSLAFTEIGFVIKEQRKNRLAIDRFNVSLGRTKS